MKIIVEIVIVIALCINLIRLFIKARKKSKQVQEQNEKDRYNDYHLGDITHYDIPKNNKFIQRSDTPLWSGRNSDKKNIRKEANEKHEKHKSDN